MTPERCSPPSLIRRRRGRSRTRSGCWRWSPARTSSTFQTRTIPAAPGGGGRWRIARRVAEERVICTVDAEVRHAHKTVSRRTHGFTAHVVVEPDTGLVTATRLTAAAGRPNSDATVGVALLADDDSTAGPIEVLADSAYGTGDALAALHAAGHTPVIKPWPLRPAVPGGFTIDDFPVDEAAGTATCPAGIMPPISHTRAVIFGAACRGCPLRTRCIARNDAWLHLRVAAINLRRLLRLGLTGTEGTWGLLPA